MPITQTICNSFKLELVNGGIHDIDNDVLKLALFANTATLGASTTAYSSSNEVVGVGYIAGGKTLTNVSVSMSGTTLIVDFDDVSWPASTITARGALIYNSSKSNRAIAVLNFNSDRSSTSGDFTIVMPVADASNAIIRIV